MPPKVKVSQSDILLAAVDIVRNAGAEALNARDIAKVLGCSTQPIFSNFATMDALRLAVMEAAQALYEEYTRQEIQTGQYPVYKSTGMAYIRFAKEEKELFKLLYMRDRSGEAIPAQTQETEQLAALIQSNTDFSLEQARLFHLEMWAFVHGIAVILATNYLDLDTELISQMLSDAFLGVKKQFAEKE